LFLFSVPFLFFNQDCQITPCLPSHIENLARSCSFTYRWIKDLNRKRIDIHEDKRVHLINSVYGIHSNENYRKISCAATMRVSQQQFNSSRRILLGSMTNYQYQQEEFTPSSGDVVVMMSDGLPERFNKHGEMLDYEVTKRALITAAHQSPQQIFEHFINVGESWTDGKPQDDDVTFVVMKLK
jgi:hypothetical protein